MTTKTTEQPTSAQLFLFFYEVFCVPLFYITLMNEIALSNLSSFDDPDNISADIKKANAIATLCFGNPLYSFLSTAPEGLLRFYDYSEMIWKGEVNLDAEWLQSHDFYKQVMQNRARAIKIGVFSFTAVFVSMLPVFLAIGAAGAKTAAEELFNQHDAITDAEALAFGASTGSNNQNLYTFALTKALFEWAKVEGPYITANSLFKWLSILISCPYAKAGFEQVTLVDQLAFLKPLQENTLIAQSFRAVFIMGIEAILLRGFTSPFTRLYQQLHGTKEAPAELGQNEKIAFCAYKTLCFASSLIAILDSSPAGLYAVFAASALASTAIESRLHTFLVNRSQNNEAQTALLADNEQENIESQNQGKESNSSASPERQLTLPKAAKSVLFVMLSAGFIGSVSSIALTVGSDPSKTGLALFNHTTDFAHDETLKIPVLVAIATTGLGANMLGLTGLVALLVGALEQKKPYEEESAATQAPGAQSYQA